MSAYNPPVKETQIFDTNNFSGVSISSSGGVDGLTKEDADKYYLQYPRAQGSETLQSVNVNGVLNVLGTAGFSSGVTFNSFPSCTADATTYTSSQLLVSQEVLLALSNQWKELNVFEKYPQCSSLVDPVNASDLTTKKYVDSKLTASLTSLTTIPTTTKTNTATNTTELATVGYINTRISGFLSSATADATYAKMTDVNAALQTKGSSSTGSLALYLPKTEATNIYLKKLDASKIYATKYKPPERKVVFDTDVYYSPPNGALYLVVQMIGGGSTSTSVGQNSRFWDEDFETGLNITALGGIAFTGTAPAGFADQFGDMNYVGQGSYFSGTLYGKGNGGKDGNSLVIQINPDYQEDGSYRLLTRYYTSVGLKGGSGAQNGAIIITAHF
jgi:hypothetical protein